MARWIYRVGARHWRLCTFSVVALTLLGGLYVMHVPMREDVTVMLPDSDPTFLASYRLLEAAPFTRSVLIDLEAPDAEHLSLLTETAGRLSERLGPPLISKVIGGLPLEAGTNLLDWLFAHLPQLFTEQDAAALAPRLAPEQIAETLQNERNALIGPEGMWLRQWLSKDPLEFRNQAFRKLGSVAVLPEARLESGFLVDPTGKHILLVAQTPVSMGDSRTGRQLLQYLDETISQTVPAALRAHVVCAHRYTVANAGTIKHDLLVVFAASTLGLVAIFVFWLRHWRALFVLAVPSLAVLAAILATTTVCRQMSVITVGFGAVLLGIAVDYGLHVFFALRCRPSDPADSLAHLAVPEAISWATTVGVFVVLLWSGIPIQRQLAVFSIAGLTAALGLAFLWLPHWAAGGAADVPARLPSWDGRRRWIAAAWLVLTLALLPVCSRVQFDGDLRQVGVTPKDVLADEHCVRDVWADPRGRGLVVVRSDDTESALRTNEQVYAELAARWGPGELVSLAPLLPSRATQLANLARWRQFWNEPGRREGVREALAEQGRKLHFTAGTFDPFLQWVQQERQPFDIAELRQLAGPLLEPLFFQQTAGLGLINFIPDNEAAGAARDTAGLNLPPGVQTVSQRQFAAALRHSLEGDFRRFLLGAAVMVVLLLAVTLRRASQVILSLLPALAGLEVMLAVMALLGLRINLFNVAASVLVIGLSIDYGVFMVCRSRATDQATDLAVLTSALTTVTGFGALALARHPALFSLGITVVLGLIPSMLCALVVVPALQRCGPTD
jgi:predicted exporter